MSKLICIESLDRDLAVTAMDYLVSQHSNLLGSYNSSAKIVIGPMADNFSTKEITFSTSDGALHSCQEHSMYMFSERYQKALNVVKNALCEKDIVFVTGYFPRFMLNSVRYADFLNYTNMLEYAETYSYNIYAWHKSHGFIIPDLTFIAEDPIHALSDKQSKYYEKLSHFNKWNSITAFGVNCK